MAAEGKSGRQLLHLVFGGRLVASISDQFEDLSAVELVGIYPNYAAAYDAWRAKAQRTVDDAMMRYYIVHLHRLLEPERPATGRGLSRMAIRDHRPTRAGAPKSRSIFTPRLEALREIAGRARVCRRRRRQLHPARWERPTARVIYEGSVDYRQLDLSVPSSSR